jgi:hypothetical protein
VQAEFLYMVAPGGSNGGGNGTVYAIRLIK